MRAILFDLDGTLLDVDGDAVLEAYVTALGRRLAPQLETETFRALVMAAALPMLRAPGGDPVLGRRFRAGLAERIGLGIPVVAACQAHLDASLDGEIDVVHAPLPAAQASVHAATRLGVPLVVATTPIYGEEAIRCRLSWAGLADVPWALITTSENMHACKPSAEYYREVAATLDVPPEDCLMVGDDPWQDGSAREAGMSFLQVGPGRPAEGDDPWAAFMRLLGAVSPRR